MSRVENSAPAGDDEYSPSQQQSRRGRRAAGYLAEAGLEDDDLMEADSEDQDQTAVAAPVEVRRAKAVDLSTGPGGASAAVSFFA
jgi:hypothetical protein